MLRQYHSNPSFSLSGHLVGRIPNPSSPPGHPAPASLNLLNMTIFPLTYKRQIARHEICARIAWLPHHDTSGGSALPNQEKTANHPHMQTHLSKRRDPILQKPSRRSSATVIDSFLNQCGKNALGSPAAVLLLDTHNDRLGSTLLRVQICEYDIENRRKRNSLRYNAVVGYEQGIDDR